MGRNEANERVWRRAADSSELTEPRVLVRVFVDAGDLEETVRYYERLQETTADMRFPFPEMGLRLAAVGSFLVIAGSARDLRPFRTTSATLLVADIRPYYERLVAEGAEILFGPREVPTGRAFNARHPDGTVLEYVHHRPDSHGR
ncbi:VOC family protein [Haloactinospora alba]|nr:VOC family protein [Haloactinospora alba]